MIKNILSFLFIFIISTMITYILMVEFLGLRTVDPKITLTIFIISGMVSFKNGLCFIEKIAAFLTGISLYVAIRLMLGWAILIVVSGLIGDGGKDGVILFSMVFAFVQILFMFVAVFVAHKSCLWIEKRKNKAKE